MIFCCRLNENYLLDFFMNSRLIVFFALFLFFSGALGFVVWQTNQNKMKANIKDLYITSLEHDNIENPEYIQIINDLKSAKTNSIYRDLALLRWASLQQKSDNYSEVVAVLGNGRFSTSIMDEMAGYLLISFNAGDIEKEIKLNDYKNSAIRYLVQDILLGRSDEIMERALEDQSYPFYLKEKLRLIQQFR